MPDARSVRERLPVPAVDRRPGFWRRSAWASRGRPGLQAGSGRGPRLASLLLLLAASVLAGEAPPPPGAPAPEPGQYQHTPPTLTSLQKSKTIHPGLKAVILRGRDIFINTQQFRGTYVFNDMNCKSCHSGEGRRAWSGPVWPAATTFPDFRGKNQQVNSLEERIAGCFAYSMNGQAPAYGSDDMVALVAYHRWLATGAPVYEGNVYGRGYRHLGTSIPSGTSRERGEALYRRQCAACHGVNGEGLQHEGAPLMPALWGDNAYNWGSGMSRIFTAAAFIHLNMPFGQAGSLSPQEAWDVALFVNSHERPQDPRYTGSAEETRQRYENFHRHSLYGTNVGGRVLGQHDNTGEKPFLKPPVLRPRNFAR